MEVVVTTGAINVQSSSENVTTNKPTPCFLQARCPSCRQANSVEASVINIEGKKQKEIFISLSANSQGQLFAKRLINIIYSRNSHDSVV